MQNPYTARDFPDAQFELQIDDKGPMKLCCLTLREMRDRHFHGYLSGKVMMFYCQHHHTVKRFDMRTLLGKEVTLRCIAARPMHLSDAEIDRLAKYSTHPQIFREIARAVLREGDSRPLRVRIIDDWQVSQQTMRQLNMKGGSLQTGLVTFQLIYDDARPKDLVRALARLVDPFELAQEHEFASRVP